MTSTATTSKATIRRTISGFTTWCARIRSGSTRRESDPSPDTSSIADVERKIAGIVKTIDDSAYNPSLKEPLTTLEKEKKAAAKAAATRPEPAARLHPGLPALFRKLVEKLAAALNGLGGGQRPARLFAASSTASC